jgi:predicted ester cyclase
MEVGTMNKKEFIKKAYAMDSPDQGAYFSDDFQWTDSLGSPPMDKSTWLGMGDLMQSAFPDIELIVEDIREEGDSLVVTSRFRGTFKKDLDLSPLGMGVIPATGKAIDFPSQADRVSIENGKISRMHNVETGPDAGMAGFFKAIGANGS